MLCACSERIKTADNGMMSKVSKQNNRKTVLKTNYYSSDVNFKPLEIREIPNVALFHTRVLSFSYGSILKYILF